MKKIICILLVMIVLTGVSAANAEGGKLGYWETKTRQAAQYFRIQDGGAHYIDNKWSADRFEEWLRKTLYCLENEEIRLINKIEADDETTVWHVIVYNYAGITDVEFLVTTIAR